MQLPVRGRLGDDRVHKSQELFPPLERGGRGLHVAGSHLQRREQVQGAVALVGTLEAAHDFAVVTL